MIRKSLFNAKGAAVVEMTISILVFFSLFFLVMDTGRVGFTWLSLNQAALEAARWGSLGESAFGSTDPLMAIEDRFYSEAEDFGIPPSKISGFNIGYLPPGDSEVIMGSAGGKDDYLVLNAQSDVRVTPLTSLIVFNERIPVSVDVVIKNE
jgi:hypothetical protein